MNKNHRLGMLLIILCFWAGPMLAQEHDDICIAGQISDEELAMSPWYGNNEFLNHVLEEANYYTSKGTFTNAQYRIPVKFWVYRTGPNNGGASEAELKQMIQDINQMAIANNTGILYYLRPDIGYINDAKSMQMDYVSEAPLWSQRNKADGCVNVHVIDKLVQNKLLGKSRTLRGTYNSLTDAVFVVRKIARTTMTHEVGHFLGLLHPHRDWDKGKCKQEAVSRSRKFKGCAGKSGLICEQNGDALCDTPAEPNIGKATNDQCRYFGKFKDAWGEAYKPATDNIMSYPRNLACRNKFTPGQVAVMLNNAKQRQMPQWNGNRNEYRFDVYEPDGTIGMASTIIMGSPQPHTLNQTYMGGGKNDDNDVDYMMFKLSSTRPVTIKLQTDANQSSKINIHLEDSKGKAITYTQKQTTNGKELQSSSLTQGTYYIRVTKNGSSPVSTCYNYTLELK